MSSEQEKLPSGQIQTKRLLRWGVDHPTIKGEILKIDIAKWVLVIDGEVDNPLSLNWSEILKLPKAKSVSNFHCVEGWSVIGCEWEGIRFKTITGLTKPRKSAKHVIFEARDGYSTSLTLEELSSDNVLLAYKLDGKILEEGYGFPLRLVVPEKYAYKSILWLKRIRFTAEKELGYWETRGYSDTADVWTNDRFSN